MKVWLYLFAVGTGLTNAVQSGCNATLGKSIGPLPAAVVIGVVTTAAATLAGLLSGGLAWPGADRLAGAPWWAWVGGVLGASFILAQLFVAGQVGSGVFIAMTVNGVGDDVAGAGPLRAGRVPGASGGMGDGLPGRFACSPGLGLIARF